MNEKRLWHCGELSLRTFWTLLREFSSRRRRLAIVLEELSGALGRASYLLGWRILLLVAILRVSNVPRLRRLPSSDLLAGYNRYCPDFSFRIICDLHSHWNRMLKNASGDHTA